MCIRDRFFIDIGAKSREEASKQVRVGQSAAFLQHAIDLGNSRMMAKAMDDRIGCVVIVEVLKKLKSVEHDIYAVFATQEEVGLRGSRVAAFGIEPDVGIAFDVTGTGDTPKARTMDVSVSYTHL